MVLEFEVFFVCEVVEVVLIGFVFEVVGGVRVGCEDFVVVSVNVSYFFVGDWFVVEWCGLVGVVLKDC